MTSSVTIKFIQTPLTPLFRLLAQARGDAVKHQHPLPMWRITICLRITTRTRQSWRKMTAKGAGSMLTAQHRKLKNKIAEKTITNLCTRYMEPQVVDILTKAGKRLFPRVRACWSDACILMQKSDVWNLGFSRQVHKAILASQRWRIFRN